MFGMEMMLKSLGINADDIQKQAKTFIDVVSDIQARLIRIESNQKTLLDVIAARPMLFENLSGAEEKTDG